MPVKFRRVFLTSDRPGVTAKFYERVASLPLETVGNSDQYMYWRLERNGVQIAIHGSKAFADYAHPPVANSNLTHLYFQIEDRDEFLERLHSFHITPSEIDDVTVTLIDPDGRHVLFGTA